MTGREGPVDLTAAVREVVPGVLSTLVRRYGDVGDCEDAVQEALLAAHLQWPAEGVPDNPRAWLLTVASRRLVESWRRDSARRRREQTVGRGESSFAENAATDVDDSLALLLWCCHPVLSPASQVALTLRAVGGLTTAEIARAYLVPETTMAQRISRAKRSVAAAGARFEPDASAGLERVGGLLKVLYLVFTEGHTASSGEAVSRVDVCEEAIRLTRLTSRALPGDGEVAGLLALMLLTHARGPARATEAGELVPLADQDRTAWDRSLIAEGTALVSDALATSAIGAYQVQAAIAAVHAEAPDTEHTDWGQIVALYDVLDTLAPGPMVTLNRVVALGQDAGADVALRALESAVAADDGLAAHYRTHAVRGHLLALAGDPQGAAHELRRAADLTPSAPERRHLLGRVDQLEH